MTHLVAVRREGQKYDAAKSWGLQVVTVEWVHACVRANSWVPERNFLLPEIVGSDGNVEVDSQTTGALAHGDPLLAPPPPNNTMSVSVPTPVPVPVVVAPTQDSVVVQLQRPLLATVKGAVCDPAVFARDVFFFGGFSPRAVDILVPLMCAGVSQSVS